MICITAAEIEVCTQIKKENAPISMQSINAKVKRCFDTQLKFQLFIKKVKIGENKDISGFKTLR